LDTLLIKREYTQKIVDAGNLMVSAVLTVGTWGNISLRDTGLCL